MTVSSHGGCFHLGVQQPPCSSHQIIPQLATSILASGSTITRSLVCWPLPGWSTIAEPGIGGQRSYIPRTRLFLRPSCKASSRHRRHCDTLCTLSCSSHYLCKSGGKEYSYQRKQLYCSWIGLRGQRQHSIHGTLNFHKPAIGTAAAGKLLDAVFYSAGTISQAEIKPHRTLCFKKN